MSPPISLPPSFTYATAAPLSPSSSASTLSLSSSSSSDGLARLMDRLALLEGRLLGVKILPAAAAGEDPAATLEEHVDRLEAAVEEHDFQAVQRQIRFDLALQRRQRAPKRTFAPLRLTAKNFSRIFAQSSIVLLLDNLPEEQLALIEGLFQSSAGHRPMLCAPANLPCYYVFDAEVAERLVSEAEKEPQIIMGHLCASNDRPIERPAAFLFNRATNRLLVDSIPMNTPDLWDALDKCTKRLWVKSERRYSLRRRQSLGVLERIVEDEAERAGEPIASSVSASF